MFPHDKLDWTLKRLERRLDEVGDDSSARAEYARALVSRAMFHDGGEVWYNKALTQARRVLQSDPANVSALVVAGLALIGIDRVGDAPTYLDEATRVDAERGDIHLAMGALYWREGERHQAVRELEAACRMEPHSWEANCMLGQLLGERADELGNPKRLRERSQYHLVRALQIGPTPALLPTLLHDLGVSCLATNRLPDAYKLFSELLEDPRYRTRARYYVGLVSYHMGKHKNAVLHLRRHLEERPDARNVHSLIAMAYLQLGELVKAREACHRALAGDPSDVEARWTLASTWLQDGQADEAVRLFKEILRDSPGHMPAFTAMVTIRHNDLWLRQALRTEVGSYDRLPHRLLAPNPSGVGEVTLSPRATTRERIAVLVEALAHAEAEQPTNAVETLLGVTALTSDEGLRFQLWDAALHQLARNRAVVAAGALKQAGRTFSASAGREILSLAGALPEPLLTMGLGLNEGDLKRAAVDRHGPTRDVYVHRTHVEAERQEARGWQALLLLSLARHDTQSSRNLLLRWASDADPELASAAQAGLTLLGDPHATAELCARCDRRGAGHLVDGMLAARAPEAPSYRPRPVSDDENLRCTTCKRGTLDVQHLLAGAHAVLCNRCAGHIAQNRREQQSDDPALACALCGSTAYEAAALYLHEQVPVCAACVDSCLGLHEREEVDRFLAHRIAGA